MSKTLFLILLLPIALLAQSPTPTPTPKPDVWKPLKFFVGKWDGRGAGQPGKSTVEREYKFVLNNKFLEVNHKSTYAPQEKNPKGEVHEDTGFLSYDRTRKQFVFRQFHIEGFVNTYVSGSIQRTGKL